MKFRRFKTNKLKFFSLFFSLMLCFLSIMLSFKSINSASALSHKSSVGVNFTFNPVLSISLSSVDLIIPNLAPGSYSDSNEIIVSVGTNTAYGYSLYATAGNDNYANGGSNYNINDLVLSNNGSISTTETNKFMSLNTTDNLSNMSLANDDTWGYAFATYNKTNDTYNTYSNYSGLPIYTEGTGAELINTKNAADGSSVKFKIAAKASGLQLAGEYTNVVNFYAVARPVPGSTPLNASDCPANRICYAPNATDVVGTMATLGTNTTLTEVSPLAGIQTQTVNSSGSSITVTSNSTAQLIAPNYKRAGYGFAGWSTDFTATSTSTIYGPNETINTGNLSTNGMILYPVWVAVDTSATMQTWSSSNCNALTQAPASGTATLASLTAVRDARDDNIYTIARLADGQCWMVENLRLNADNSTDSSLAQGFGDAFVGLADSEDTNFSNSTTANSLYSTTNITGSNQGYRFPRYNNTNTNATLMGGTGLNATGTSLEDAAGYPINSSTGQSGVKYSWYSYGNYYTWAAAIADTTNYTSSNAHTTVATSICPNGWHLPYGNSGSSSPNLGNTVGGFYYLASRIGATASSAASSMIWRKFPNNFVYSGLWYGSSASYRGSNGLYWSSSTGGINNAFDNAYYLYFYSAGVNPGTYGNNKYNGFSVRCVAGS